MLVIIVVKKGTKQHNVRHPREQGKLKVLMKSVVMVSGLGMQTQQVRKPIQIEDYPSQVKASIS